MTKKSSKRTKFKIRAKTVLAQFFFARKPFWRETSQACRQLKGQLDVRPFEVLVGPRVELLEDFASEVVPPIADLAFPEELPHDLLHLPVPHRHVLGSVLPVVADVQVVVLERKQRFEGVLGGAVAE